MKKLLLVLVLVASAKCLAWQNTNDNDTADTSGQTLTFAQVVNKCFNQWDVNGDGTLSTNEINAAVANPSVRGESAAAIAIIRMVLHGGNYALPPITQAYLVSHSSPESSSSDEQPNLKEGADGAQKTAHVPAFQPRYRKAVRRLRESSRDLFPESVPSLAACHQEGLGDCYFLSVVGAMVHRNPSAVKAMFSQGDDGSITVAFGDGRNVKVGRPTDAEIVICSTAGANGLWLAVLEKAFRQVCVEDQHGAHEGFDLYDRLHGGSAGQVIGMVGGHGSRHVALHNGQPGGQQLAHAVHQD